MLCTAKCVQIGKTETETLQTSSSEICSVSSVLLRSLWDLPPELPRVNSDNPCLLVAHAVTSTVVIGAHFFHWLRPRKGVPPRQTPPKRPFCDLVKNGGRRAREKLRWKITLGFTMVSRGVHRFKRSNLLHHKTSLPASSPSTWPKHATVGTSKGMFPRVQSSCSAHLGCHASSLSDWTETCNKLSYKTRSSLVIGW